VLEIEQIGGTQPEGGLERRQPVLHLGIDHQ
jgi:hypothetical protein